MIKTFNAGANSNQRQKQYIGVTNRSETPLMAQFDNDRNDNKTD